MSNTCCNPANTIGCPTGCSEVWVRERHMKSDAVATGTAGQQATVFLSYSRGDQKRALPLIKAIEEAGYSVWWDGLLGGGERYFQTTQAALEAAKAVVVLWSKVSVASHWVHDEATRARDRNCLVPVTIDGTPPPLGFGQFQTIALLRAGRLRAGDPAIANLIAAIGALHDSGEMPAPRPAAQPRGIERRAVLAGVGAVGAVAAGAAWWGGLFGGGQNANSVAVLPFANLSGDPSESYFSDGVAAEIRSELARNSMLQVAAQASSESFRERNDDARTMARKLQVSHLLDGNIRKSGDMVRVAVELTEGATGFSKWSQSFDRPLADVFAVQEEIAQAVATALSAELSRGSGAKKAAKAGTNNIAAYDAFLKGSALYQLASGEQSARDTLAKFEEAVALDPGYAAAWSGRSRTLASIANQYLDGSARAATFEQAIATANKALKLAPDLADAHSALGYATFFGRRNARAARAPFERSARLGQGQSDVLTRYAVYCAFTGSFDVARTAINRAARLDPLNPLVLRAVGTVEFTARRYSQAIAAIQRTLALNPKMNGARAAIGFSQLMLGQTGEAGKSFDAEPSELRRLTGQAMVARRQGRAADAAAALSRIEDKFGTSALYEQAQVLAQWGERDRAMATLLEAAATGDPGIVLIRADPLIDPLRERAEFSDLLKQAGFG